MKNIKSIINSSPASNIDEDAKTKFSQNKNAIATNDIRKEKFNMNKPKEKSKDAMMTLGIDGCLQSMLVAQMLSIHELQQRTMTYANGVDNLELKKYYTNAAVKLSNCFVQQANVLAKLQGVGG